MPSGAGDFSLSPVLWEYQLNIPAFIVQVLFDLKYWSAQHKINKS